MTEQPDLFGDEAKRPRAASLPDVTRSHHGRHPESEAANVHVQPSKEAMMWKVIAWIADYGPATADGIAARWECSHNHVAPRISEAKALELLRELRDGDGRYVRERTRSGCTARVVGLTDKAREILKLGCPETGDAAETNP